MTWVRALALCLLITAVADVCSGLMLDRLPRHIPRSKVGISPDSLDDDDIGDSLDTSVEKKRLYQDKSQLSPFIMKPTWKAIYPFAHQNKRTHRKRNVAPDHSGDSVMSDFETSERDKHELANILKDDDEAEKKSARKDTHSKTKRQSSNEEAESTNELMKEEENEEQEQTVQNPEFQDWLRREYYRNMAKTFASMRRKRDNSHVMHKTVKKRTKKSVRSTSSLSEITDNLRNIEDQLFQDALQVMREGGEDYEDDIRRQHRITNDLSLAYDLETMRNAFFRLRETLGSMASESSLDEEEMYHTSRKRSKECPSLDQLTSDCSALSDIISDGPMKRLLLRACNWHEVCYTCGKAYGLTSENCDGSFIEQTQTICQDDAPCESTASLLMVPLRQRRVFYKRSNPDVCVEDPCVEAFLKEGLAAMEEGSRYSMENNLRNA